MASAKNVFLDPEILAGALFDISLYLGGWYDELLIQEKPKRGGAARGEDLAALRKEWEKYYEDEDEIILMKLGGLENLWPR
jgi:hypothetical protein